MTYYLRLGYRHIQTIWPNVLKTDNRLSIFIQIIEEIFFPITSAARMYWRVVLYWSPKYGCLQYQIPTYKTHQANWLSPVRDEFLDQYISRMEMDNSQCESRENMCYRVAKEVYVDDTNDLLTTDPNSYKIGDWRAEMIGLIERTFLQFSSKVSPLTNSHKLKSGRSTPIYQSVSTINIDQSQPSYDTNLLLLLKI